jgi:CheY-specific phosphatase CheX
MKMELIQPFINATDAVLAETLRAPARIGDVAMEEESYRRKGVAAIVRIRGDIEGRVIFDLEPEAATQIASMLGAGDDMEADQIVKETVCEIANMVIGNAVMLLNDQGFHFKVFPPEVHTGEEGLKGDQDTEAVVMCFELPTGCVYLNIAMRYHHRRSHERDLAMPVEP